MRKVVLSVAAAEAAANIGPWQEPETPDALMDKVRLGCLGGRCKQLCC